MEPTRTPAAAGDSGSPERTVGGGGGGALGTAQSRQSVRPHPPKPQASKLSSSPPHRRFSIQIGAALSASSISSSALARAQVAAGDRRREGVEVVVAHRAPLTDRPPYRGRRPHHSVRPRRAAAAEHIPTLRRGGVVLWRQQAGVEDLEPTRIGPGHQPDRRRWPGRRRRRWVRRWRRKRRRRRRVHVATDGERIARVGDPPTRRPAKRRGRGRKGADALQRADAARPPVHPRLQGVGGTRGGRDDRARVVVLGQALLRPDGPERMRRQVIQEDVDGRAGRVGRAVHRPVR
eukprot:scaffold14936_cov89-Isochrysis_galbana.AAC.2